MSLEKPANSNVVRFPDKTHLKKSSEQGPARIGSNVVNFAEAKKEIIDSLKPRIEAILSAYGVMVLPSENSPLEIHRNRSMDIIEGACKFLESEDPEFKDKALQMELALRMSYDESWNAAIDIGKMKSGKFQHGVMLTIGKPESEGEVEFSKEDLSGSIARYIKNKTKGSFWGTLFRRRQ